MKNSNPTEIDKIVDKLIFDYSDHIEADDDLSDWHIEKPIIFQRKLVEAKTALTSLLNKEKSLLIEQVIDVINGMYEWSCVDLERAEYQSKTEIPVLPKKELVDEIRKDIEGLK